MSTDEPQTTRASDTSRLLKYLALGEKLVNKFFYCFAFICLWITLILRHPSLTTGGLNQGINWGISILIIRAVMKSGTCNLLQAKFTHFPYKNNNNKKDSI